MKNFSRMQIRDKVKNIKKKPRNSINKLISKYPKIENKINDKK